MVAIVLAALVAVVLIAIVLDRLGYADGTYMQTIEWFRVRGAALWWLLVGAVMIATGIFTFQILGFVVLLYLAVVAVGLYDVDLGSVRSTMRTAWRKVT